MSATTQEDTSAHGIETAGTQYGHHIVVGLLAALVAASAFEELRIPVMGLLVHPYLVPLTVVGVVWGFPNTRRVPRNFLTALILLLTTYILAMMLDTLTPTGKQVAEVIKLASAVFAVITIAAFVRSDREFVWGSAGLVVAAIAIAFPIIRAGSDVSIGVNPLEGIGNKNAFSLYALPPMLLAGHLVLDRQRALRLRVAAAAGALTLTLAVFSTANRSGWVGVVLIYAMLGTYGRRLRGAVLVGALSVTAAGMVFEYAPREVLEERVARTEAGYGSDTLRKAIFIESMKISVQNPILGVGPLRLPWELARRLHFHSNQLGAHNVFGQTAGGAGLVALFALLWAGRSLWRRRRGIKAESEQARKVHAALRMMVALWAVRGMFNDEILYSPSFCIGLGLLIGRYQAVLGVDDVAPIPATHEGRNHRSVRAHRLR